MFLLLGLSLLILILTLSFAGSRLAGTRAAGIGPSGGTLPPGATPPTLTCGSAGLPACPQASVWIPLRSTAPADLVAAAKQSALFSENRTGNGDHAKDLTRLGAPVFVRALQPNGAGVMPGVPRFPDFYVLPILDATGATTDAAELELNATRTAIHVIAIVTYAQPRLHGVIAQRTANQAATAVSAEHHVGLRVSAQPQLVYFPGDARAQELGQVRWTGGGQAPADPLWLVPGADGRDHFVGVDGHAYYTAQLPMIGASR